MSLKQSYTLIAPFYDAAIDRATRAARKHSLSALPAPPGRVLLAGVGTGLDLPHLPPQHRYVGVDLTHAMLRRVGPRTGAADFAAVQGDAQRLPFADASFDHAVLHLILAVVPEPARCLGEVARVLKPGGYLLRAYPLREHLWELKALIYDTPRDNPPTPLTTEGFTLVETREVRDIIHLSCNEDILSLFRMTPYYYKTGAKDQQKAERAQELSVKLAFGLAIYQKD